MSGRAASTGRTMSPTTQQDSKRQRVGIRSISCLRMARLQEITRRWHAPRACPLRNHEHVEEMHRSEHSSTSPTFVLRNSIALWPDVGLSPSFSATP